jgi:hypothetical protein
MLSEGRKPNVVKHRSKLTAPQARRIGRLAPQTCAQDLTQGPDQSGGRLQQHTRHVSVVRRSYNVQMFDKVVGSSSSTACVTRCIIYGSLMTIERRGADTNPIPAILPRIKGCTARPSYGS